MKNKCPKCGFFMLDTNCPKCGYEKESIYKNKYKNITTDLELLLKDEHKKIIHNKNILLIIFLGPIYFAYYNLCIPSIILTMLEFFIYRIVTYNIMLVGTLSSILFFLLIMVTFVFLRIIYLGYYNPLLLIFLNKRLERIKRKENYKELIYKYKPKSILKPIIVILTTILINNLIK